MGSISMILSYYEMIFLSALAYNPWRGILLPSVNYGGNSDSDILLTQGNNK